MTFHAWYPGCPMEDDAYGIPKPKDTELIVPHAAVCALRGLWPRRLPAGLWWGFYDRMLAALNPEAVCRRAGVRIGFCR